MQVSFKRIRFFIFAAFFGHFVDSTADCYDSTAHFVKSYWAHCHELDAGVLVYSGVSTDGGYMKLGLQINHIGGWSALGLSGNGGMKGANEIVVRQSGGSWVAEDRYSTAYEMPSLDTAQNVRLIFAVEEGNTTYWGVLVPMDSCDTEAYPIEDIRQWIIWACGSSHDFTYHGATTRGQSMVNLVSGPYVMNATESTSFNITVVMPNVPVVMGEGGADASNPYICNMIDLQEHLSGQSIDTKYHAVRISPSLDPASQQYVHHILIFDCTGLDEERNWTNNMVVGECESMVDGCSNILWAWAQGVEDIVFPSHVGLPVGEGVRWWAMQTHYYNPNLDTGIFDSSGATFAIVSDLRSNDAAMLQLNGGTSEIRDSLPPGRENCTIPTFAVPSQCTNMWEADLAVLGVLHHAHLIGKHIQVEVTRNGAYKGLMRREHMYDFNHQSFADSLVPYLQAGDELTVTCVYDTSSRANYTTFGDSSQMEMCFVLVMYYPKQDLSNIEWQPPREAAENTAFVADCLAPGNYSDYFRNYSMCAQFLYFYPAKYIFDSDYDIDLSAACNYFPGELEGYCAECYQFANCTMDVMVPYAQGICERDCLNVGVSAYPNTTNNYTYPTHVTYCDQMVYFKPTAFNPPTCNISGDIWGSTATSIISEMNPTDEACGNTVHALAAAFVMLSWLT